LSAEQAEQLQQLARRLWAKSLQQFLQTATVAEQRSVAQEGPKYRVRFGVYFNDTQQEAPVADAQASAAPRKNKRSPKP
jgi:hypothetical protein